MFIYMYSKWLIATFKVMFIYMYSQWLLECKNGIYLEMCYETKSLTCGV